MASKADIRAEAARLSSVFCAHGAEPVEADILQPAEVLLDLYGEDIRARAYVTHDPLRGETMLRPDFTVPVAQAFLGSGRPDARYTYAGQVFRRQEEDETRAREYMQVGYECFGQEPASVQDADVFFAMSRALEGVDVQPVIGDIGIVAALIEDLDAPDRRKAALRRHIWRPARFRRLLERFSKVAPTPPAFDAGIQRVGLRAEGEIRARLYALADEAATEPLSGSEIDLIDRVMAVSVPYGRAIETLQGLAAPGTALEAAVAGLVARLGELQAKGIAAEDLWFEAGYGRQTMEYYGGFVFGFYTGSRASGPAVATGGRFDMVTAALGRAVPAVGGVIRPDLVLEAGI